LLVKEEISNDKSERAMESKKLELNRRYGDFCMDENALHGKGIYSIRLNKDYPFYFLYTLKNFSR